MSKATGSEHTASDPFELWRQIYDANEKAWSSALEQAMGQPTFAEQTGKMLETFLASQKIVRDNMRIYLETINVPTREDIARLGELIVALEEKIDQLDDRLAGLEAAIRVTLAARPAPMADAPTGAADGRKAASTASTTARRRRRT